MPSPIRTEKLDSKGDSVRLSHGDDDEGDNVGCEGNERDDKCRSETKELCDEGKDEKEDRGVFEGRSPSFYFDTSVDSMDMDVDFQ